MDTCTESPSKKSGHLRRDLVGLERSEVYQQLHSFDERGLSPDEVLLNTIALLDTAAISGLDRALEQGAHSRVLDIIGTHFHGADAPLYPEFSGLLGGAEHADADDILGNRFTLYHQTHQLPPTIDWDQLPGDGQWGHFCNRFSFLYILIKAYRDGRDDRYSRKAVELVLQWIDSNDVSRCFDRTPYAFGSYLNQAAQIEAWSDCLSVLLAYRQVEPKTLLRILKSIHELMWYLRWMSEGDSGNWPTYAHRSILCALARFPVFRDSAILAKHSIDQFDRVLQAQILPDGAQYELAPLYHYTVTVNAIKAVDAARTLGRDFPPQTHETLRKMVRYLCQTITPDGLGMAAFNDSDTGFRAWAQLKSLCELTGNQHLLEPNRVLASEHFPHAGVSFLRQSSSRGDLYLAFDGGPYGYSHQHEDKLSFCLFAYGRHLIVDPGKHMYDTTSSRSYFNHLRSTRAHSTVLVDGQGQHRQGMPPATWVSQPAGDCLWRVRHPDAIHAAAIYREGYGPQNAVKVIHKREIVFVKQRLWVVFDYLQGQLEHEIQLRFQFAPGDLILDGNKAYTSYSDSNLLVWAIPSEPFADVHVEKGQDDPVGGWYSHVYGHVEPAPALCYTLYTGLPLRIATVLYPYRGHGCPHVLVGGDGRSLEIQTDEIEQHVEPCLYDGEP